MVSPCRTLALAAPARSRDGADEHDEREREEQEAGGELDRERARDREGHGNDPGAIERGPPAGDGAHGKGRVCRQREIDVPAPGEVVHSGDRRDHQPGDRCPAWVDAALARPAVGDQHQERGEGEHDGAGGGLGEPGAGDAPQQHGPHHLHLDALGIERRHVVRHDHAPAGRDVGLRDREVIEEGVARRRRREGRHEGQGQHGADQRDSRARRRGERWRRRARCAIARPREAGEPDAGDQRGHRHPSVVEVRDAQGQPHHRPRRSAEQAAARQRERPRRSLERVPAAAAGAQEQVDETEPGQHEDGGDEEAPGAGDDAGRAHQPIPGKRAEHVPEQPGEPARVLASVQEEGGAEQEQPGARDGGDATPPVSSGPH